MATRRVGALVVACWAVLAACSENPQAPDLEPGESFSATARGVQIQSRGVRTFDDLMIELGYRIPGFAGYHVDPTTQELIVRLARSGAVERAPGERLAQAFRELEPHLPPPFRSGPRRVETAKYTFQQLKEWHDALFAQLPARAISLTDVDEVANRVLIGVPTQGFSPSVETLARALGVPGDALEIREIAHAPMDHHVLQTSVIPRLPGTQVAYFDNSDGGTYLCSMGLNLKRLTAPGVEDGFRYFITAAHCDRVTGGFGVVTGQTMGQPTLGSPIGVEIVDAPLFTNQDNPECPVGRQCRYSDASLYRYDQSQSVHQGFVATIVSTHTLARRQITSMSWGWAPGVLLHKTGRSTGMTAGTLTNTCVNMPQSLPGGIDTGRTMLCQGLATYQSAGGDSGGPVFHMWGGDGSNGISMVGIHWRGSGGFSPINQVLAEIGDPINDPLAYPAYRVWCC